jgi:Fe-coproporphyrin III synthase
MMPHSRCNCRCVMCDIWKANNDKNEVSVETLQSHIQTFKKLGVREIVFSGGEALMHSNLWAFASLLKTARIRLTLLSTGLLLARNAEQIVKHFDGVIVSIDGSEEVHDRIRQIPNGFKKIAEGVKALKILDAKFPVAARCVLQRYNYADFINIVYAAKTMGLDQISFLAADVSSSAFNRVDPWSQNRISEIALTQEEALGFQSIAEESFKTLRSEYETKFIAERPEKIMRIASYYQAINGSAAFPKTVCDAPWVSAVIESDGNVLPCFFHKPYGNIYEQQLATIINSKTAIAFRKSLNVNENPICKKCVCTLKLGLTEMT